MFIHEIDAKQVVEAAEVIAAVMVLSQLLRLQWSLLPVLSPSDE